MGTSEQKPQLGSAQFWPNFRPGHRLPGHVMFVPARAEARQTAVEVRSVQDVVDLLQRRHDWLDVLVWESVRKRDEAKLLEQRTRRAEVMRIEGQVRALLTGSPEMVSEPSGGRG